MGERHHWCSLGPHGSGLPEASTGPLVPFSAGWMSVIMVNKYMIEMGEKERQDGLYAMVRGSSEEVRVVRNGLMLTACLPPCTRWHLGLGCCQGPCLGSYPSNSQDLC